MTNQEMRHPRSRASPNDWRTFGAAAAIVAVVAGFVGWTVTADLATPMALQEASQVRSAVLVLTALLGIFLVAGLTGLQRMMRSRHAVEAELRKSSNALQTNESRLKLAIEVARLGTWEWNIISNEFIPSPELVAMHGLTGEVDSANGGIDAVFDAIVEADREVTRSAVIAAIEQGSEFEAEYRVHATDGVIRWLLTNGRVDQDDQGEPTRIVSVTADVTDRHIAEHELRASQAFLDSVVENIPNMVFVKDAEQLRFVRFNKAGEELIGTSRDEMIGRSDFDLFPEDQAEFFTAKDREVLANRNLVEIPSEVITTRHHGERVLRTRKIPILDPSGEPAFLLGISEDITDQQRAQQALETAHDEANRANQAKSEFLSRMSHELRTPLNAVLGFSQLLAMDDLNTDQYDSVESIRRAGMHLLDLINDVLDIARIEAGRLRFSLEPVHLEEVLTNAIELIQGQADEHGISISVADHDRQLHVRADRQRLLQVVLNLLSNAVKYNRPNGQILITCESSGGTASISIADTGFGISDAGRSKLFTPFERLGAEATEIEGTGVGLALSKVLASHMGGSLTVSSEEGVGSTFTLEVPTTTPVSFSDSERQRMPLARPVFGGSRPLTLLTFEDNVANVALIEQALKRTGEIHLLTAIQGRLGLELARQQQPDLILLDLHLPDIDGTQVLRQLRADPVTASIPVVICSADAHPNQINRLIEIGANAYLTKPLVLAELFEIIDQVRSNQPISHYSTESEGQLT